MSSPSSSLPLAPSLAAARTHPCVPGGRSHCRSEHSADPYYRQHQMTVGTADRGITCRARGCTSKNGQCLRCPYEVRPSAYACSRYTRRCAVYRAMSTRCLRLRCVRAWCVPPPVECMWYLATRSSMAGMANPTPPYLPLVHATECRFYMPRVSIALHTMSDVSLNQSVPGARAQSSPDIRACRACWSGHLNFGSGQKTRGGAAWKLEPKIGSPFTFPLHFFYAAESVSCLNVLGFRSPC
ncbi:hypothetical protein FB451DRAFT_1278104 [Mycena latifolia]|nr:hypothetical protein FB451DRAFT_1278104 [Mycena latifolia]